MAKIIITGTDVNDKEVVDEIEISEEHLNKKDMEPLNFEEMKILLERQLNPTVHPYTCKCGMNLYPIGFGWSCGTCGYFQNYGKLELELVGRK